MGRRKKPKKKKTSSQPDLTAEEEASVLAILQEAENTDPVQLMVRVPDARHALSLIERTRSNESPSVPLLLALREKFEDKPVQKAIKRALFSLDQKGFSTGEYSESENRPSFIVKSPEVEKPRAFLGPILNLFGSRAVSLTHFRVPKGRLMGLGLISDEDGFHDFYYGAFSKKRAKKMGDQLEQNAGPLVETSLSHAATILEAAYHRHVEIHPKAPPFYLELRPWLLENTSPYDRSIIFDFFPKNDATNRIPSASHLKELFDHSLMKEWRVEFKRIQPFIEELVSTWKSPIVLSESQKSEQESRIRKKCVEKAFSVSEEHLLKQRLEEMAFIFFKLEKPDLSEICLEAAQTIDQATTDFENKPVIAFLVEKSFDFYLNLVNKKTPDKKEAAEQAESRIILP